MEDALRIDRIGRLHRAVLERLPPFRDILLYALAPSSIRVLIEQRQECGKRLLAVSNKRIFHRVTQRDVGAVDIDLHAAGVTRLGQELAIGKGGSNHEKRVALLHQVPAWLGAEKAERPGHKRQVVRYRGFTKQRLGKPGIETLGNGDHLIGRVRAPAPTSIATLVPLLRISAAFFRSSMPGNIAAPG